MLKKNDIKGAVVIIGANNFQNQLILKAKSMGLVTHVFAWENGDVGEKNADFFYPISIVEKEKILAVCENIKPLGIISIGSDLASITVNYIAEKMGLIGNGMRSSLLSTNKHEMRMAFEKAGLPSPRSVLLIDNELNIKIPLKYPLIIKPTDRSGSRGIYKADSPQELTYAIERARKESFEKKVLIEEFVEGKEYSIEAISYQGEHHILTITEKFTTGVPKFIETGHIEPADIPIGLQDKIEIIIQEALTALEILYGATHSEIKIDKAGNVKIIEIGGRMGGDCIGSDLVPISTGFDYMKMVLDIACGKKPNICPVGERHFAFIKFILCNADLEILDKIRMQYGHNIYRVSDIIEESKRSTIEDSSTRWGYYIISTKDQFELDKIVEQANKTLAV